MSELSPRQLLGAAAPWLAWSGADEPPVLRLANIDDVATADRRIVLVLPSVGAEPAAMDLLRALAAAGYRVHDCPADGDGLAARLRAADETFARSDYAAWFAALPRALQTAVEARWGAPERDPLFREGELDCGHFALAAVRFGNVAVVRPPTAPDPGQPPRHASLAFRAWLVDGMRAHAVVRLGERGALEAALRALVTAQAPRAR
jgi:cobalamin biosynthesis Mg chelatase CobN